MSTKKMQNMEDILFFSGDDYLRVSKGMIRMVGVECAFMFSELVDEYLYYYKEKYDTITENDGWFYSTAENIKERTGWSAEKQDRIINELIQKGLIEKMLKGVPAKRHFKINTEEALNLVTDYHETRFRETKKQVNTESGNKLPQNPDTRFRFLRKLDSTEYGNSVPQNQESNKGKLKRNINKGKLNKDIEKDKKEYHASSFQKPNIDDIQNYCSQRNNAIDAESFYHHYESVGWRVGNKPMKSWQSAVITWEKRNHPTAKQNNNFSQTYGNNNIQQGVQKNEVRDSGHSNGVTISNGATRTSVYSSQSIQKAELEAFRKRNETASSV